jgi:DNA (cytosine-5)-methyltransferase 1
MKGCSLFSSAGIAETFFPDLGINIIAANEIIERRANLYRSLNQDTRVIVGDILDKKNFKMLTDAGGRQVDILIATPPCQGISIAGKNRKQYEFVEDERNYLIFKVIEFINKKKPEYVLIENVPLFLKLWLPRGKKLYQVKDLLVKEFKGEYNIETEIVDSSEYGVPQVRNRAIIKLFKKGLNWGWPTKSKIVTTEKSIGHLPSLESGEKSKIPWHYARKHIDRHVLWMKNTPTGKTAYENKKYYPQKEDGTRVKGFESSYRRIRWDVPAPAITIRNDAISSQRNVHPGRKLKDGTYSDARVLTPHELMLLTSLPANWNIPADTPEILVRQCIGECIPPLLVKKIIGCIGCQ